jgi:hypothetical protein
MLSLKLPTSLVLALTLGFATALPHAALAESAAHGAATEHAEAGAVEHTASVEHAASAETPVAAETGHDSHGVTHAVEGDHASTGCDTDALAKDVEVRKVNAIAAATMLPPPGCAWPAEEVEVHAEAGAAAGEGGGHSAPAKSGGH